MNFNFSDVDTSASSSLLPTGDYQVVCEKADWKKNNAGTGEYITSQFRVTDGEYRGRVVFAMYNLIHPNQQAVSIAMSQITQFLENSGHDKSNLKNISKSGIIVLMLDSACIAHIKTKKSKDPQYEDSNAIAYYKKLNDGPTSLVSDLDEIPF